MEPCDYGEKADLSSYFFRISDANFAKQVGGRLAAGKNVVVVVVCDVRRCDDDGNCDDFRKAMEAAVIGRKKDDVHMGLMGENTASALGAVFSSAFDCGAPGAVFFSRWSKKRPRAKTLHRRSNPGTIASWLERCISKQEEARGV